jgi:hypothetical protein
MRPAPPVLGVHETPIAESETVIAWTPAGVPGSPFDMSTETGADALETWPRVSTEATLSVLWTPAGTATSVTVPFTWRYVAPLRETR